MTTHHFVKRTGLWPVTTALAVALFTLAVTTTAANASVGTASDRTDFAAQAKAAHLTSKQVTALNKEASRIQAKLGGTRVALNVIDLNGKGTVRLVVQGEAYPRDLTSTAGTPAAARPNPCLFYADYGHMCAYSAEYFQGNVIDMYTCSRYAMPWGGYGSFDNNQTTGTRPVFFNSSGQGYLQDAARSYSYSYSWFWVWSIDNC